MWTRPGWAAAGAARLCSVLKLKGLFFRAPTPSLTIRRYLHSSLQNGVSPLLFRNPNTRLESTNKIRIASENLKQAYSQAPEADNKPVHEDVAVPGQALPAEGAGVHGAAAGLGALERLDGEEEEEEAIVFQGRS